MSVFPAMQNTPQVTESKKGEHALVLTPSARRKPQAHFVCTVQTDLWLADDVLMPSAGRLAVCSACPVAYCQVADALWPYLSSFGPLGASYFKRFMTNKTPVLEDVTG